MVINVDGQHVLLTRSLERLVASIPEPRRPHAIAELWRARVALRKAVARGDDPYAVQTAKARLEGAEGVLTAIARNDPHPGSTAKARLQGAESILAAIAT